MLGEITNITIYRQDSLYWTILYCRISAKDVQQPQQTSGLQTSGYGPVSAGCFIVEANNHIPQKRGRKIQEQPHSITSLGELS